MKNIFLFFFLFLNILITAQAQQTIVKGQVRDQHTNQPLPFVSILINEGPNGTTADIDGKFQVKNAGQVQQLTFSYLGYEPQKISISGFEQVLTIKLKPAVTNLREVVIKAGFNPAHRIVKNATQNRKNNDPAELPEYTYRVYTKMAVTFSPEKLARQDTLKAPEQKKKNAKPLTKADSLEMAADKADMEKFLAQSHLFFSESIADHAYMKPDLDKETVLATRVAGLQKPSFAMLSTDSKAFSVYQDLVTFFGKSYLGPLSEGSTKKYDFRLEDTTYQNSDTTFIISYKPLPGKNFEGLKGQLHITTDGWAVTNIIAESNEKNQQGIKLQQHYEKIGGQKWFPVQVNTDLDMKSLMVNDHKPTAFTRSYYSQINLKPELKHRDFKAITIKMNEDAHTQPETFWAQNRPDTLSFIEQNTYVKIDSLGKKIHLERSYRIMEALFSKQIPVGPISLRTDRFLKINRYENYRFGLGANTNSEFSRHFSIGGYAGYGLRDKAWKYGSDLSLNLYKPSQLKLTFTYSEDVAESGGITLPFYSPSVSNPDYRIWGVSNMDKVTHQSAFMSARVLKYLDIQTGLQQEYKRTTNGYTYEQNPDEFRSNFHITEAVIGARYAFREQIMQMFNTNISLSTNYPIVWFEYRQGLKELIGEFSYHKFRTRLEKTVKFKNLGSTTFNLDGGLVRGNVPYSNLFNGYGADYDVYGTEGFQTMGMNEFLNDRFASVFLRHNFAKLLFRTKEFSPSLTAVTSIGFGDLNNPEKHRNIDFKKMNKGYYESGLLVNDIISGQFAMLGVGVFYRYGPYQLPKTKDNVAFKMALVVPLQ